MIYLHDEFEIKTCFSIPSEKYFLLVDQNEADNACIVYVENQKLYFKTQSSNIYPVDIKQCSPEFKEIYFALIRNIPSDDDIVLVYQPVDSPYFALLS